MGDDQGKPASTCVYVINKLDVIISVSDSWLLFARENQAGESCHPDSIVNRAIWEFIAGAETKQFYDILLTTVRTRNKTVVLPFRCDSPDKRRFLELTLSPIRQDHVEFSSRVILEEARDTVEIFKPDIPRSDELIKMCSMCKKVALAENRWVEVEVALVSLKLFEKNRLPRISHGLCNECFKSGMSEIDKFC